MNDATTPPALLDVADLHAFYGKSHILQAVDLHIAAGEIVCLLGRNGVGRSTLLKAIIGELPPKGSIRFKGREIAGLPAYRIARLGIGYVPENRDIFPTLSVRDNLVLGMKGRGAGGRFDMGELFQLFPQLEARADVPGGALSGGEQQMLTIARTLMGDPDLIMIDEPTEGLAPKMVERVAVLLDAIRQRGIAILLVEQKLTIALDVADRLYVMGRGRMVFDGTREALDRNDEIRRQWLEL